MSCERTVDGMVADLLNGGWDRIRHDLWRAPWGTLYRGPHRAWHVWAGTPMCAVPGTETARPEPEVRESPNYIRRWLDRRNNPRR